jgi:isoleucyl-tRNA synthetase
VHEKREGLVVASAEGVTVALDTILTEELIRECMAREFVSRVQNIRKDLNFDVVDRICIDIHSTEKFKIAINSQLNYIQTETLAETIEFLTQIDDGIELSVEGENVIVKVRKNK